MIEYDCHAHVYEHLSAVPGARYVPKAPAPLDTWTSHLQRHALRGGVIVQVSFLGTDNTALCDALAQVGMERFRGVAVVPISIGTTEIQRLYDAGIRGCRWNHVQGGEVPDIQNADVRAFLDRIQDQNMHLELHLESPRLATHVGPLLATGVTLVIDHIGLPVAENPDDDPWLQTLTRMQDLSRLYVKLSAPYRTPFDTAQHIDVLHTLLEPNHLIWGSDWPHTRHESVTDYSTLASIRNRLGIASDAQAVRQLYGIE